MNKTSCFWELCWEENLKHLSFSQRLISHFLSSDSKSLKTEVNLQCSLNTNETENQAHYFWRAKSTNYQRTKLNRRENLSSFNHMSTGPQQSPRGWWAPQRGVEVMSQSWAWVCLKLVKHQDKDVVLLSFWFFCINMVNIRLKVSKVPAE